MLDDSSRTALRRIAVFTDAVPTASTIETIEALVTRLADVEVLVVCGGAPRPRGRWLRAKLRRLRREPLSYPLELLTEAAARLRARRPRAATGGVGLPPLEALPRTRVLRVADINGDDCRAVLQAFAPELGVGIGPPLLRHTIFGAPERGTLNLHKSLLPDYRGMPPGFWELHDGSPTSGVSVHWMEAALDAGAIVRQRALRIDPYATTGGLLARLDALGIEVLVDAVRAVLDGETGGEPQGTPLTPTRGRPPFLLARAVHRRLERRRRPQRGLRPALRALGKAAFLRAWLHGWAPLRNLWRRARGRCHTTILLYHRVSDEFLDSVTVGIEQFQRQLRLLRARYDVLDLATWLRTRGRPRRRPAVVLTFDDGYADNHLAAMLLRRAGLPCTFFVCTRIVGSDRAFPQDERKLGRTVPALSWEQVADMARWRFAFGNHTTEHRNLADLPCDEALATVATASGDLVAHLGAAGGERWLAYPYGRRQHMREDIRAALPNAAIDCCFAAFGGVNPPDFDPLRIARQGINWAVSDLALRAIVEGWRPA
jgi:methionyl-tRNA formyltransferase/peptidoglycan/xylan/chitin deacetylase (PgdA/CDA1 family)